VFASRIAYEQAQQLAKVGQVPLQRHGYITWLPGMLGGWTAMRDAPAVPQQTFREWWRSRDQGSGIRDQEVRDRLTPDPRPLTPGDEV
jgi:L-lactate dehydrogenase complex protein LldF